MNLSKKQRTRIKVKEYNPSCFGKLKPDLHRETSTASCEPLQGGRKGVSLLQCPRGVRQVTGGLHVLGLAREP